MSPPKKDSLRMRRRFRSARRQSTRRNWPCGIARNCWIGQPPSLHRVPGVQFLNDRHVEKFRRRSFGFGGSRNLRRSERGNGRDPPRRPIVIAVLVGSAADTDDLQHWRATDEELEAAKRMRDDDGYRSSRYPIDPVLSVSVFAGLATAISSGVVSQPGDRYSNLRWPAIWTMLRIVAFQQT